MNLSFMKYFTCSMIAMVALIIYAYQSKEQFYPTILFLVSSKVSFVLTGNMIVATSILLARVIKSLFFGSLRGVEVELLFEKAKYSITETCLALTVFRHEITPVILMIFGSLIFVKAFHWLAKSRLEYNEQIQPLPMIARARMTALIFTLVVTDLVVSRYCINHTFEQVTTF